MKPKLVRFKVTVRDSRPIDLGGFLDMLRYDGPRVAAWEHADGCYVVELEGERLTEGRWQSFGLIPEIVPEVL